MLKRLCCWCLLVCLSFFACGCALIPIALSAAASYGIYQATKGD